MTLARPWAELLDYLGEIGYGDLYLRPSGDPLRPARGRGPGSREVQRAEVAQRGTAPPAPRASAARDASSEHEKLAGAPGQKGSGELPVSQSLALSLSELEAEASQCRACRLCERRAQVVFGTGNPDADVMLIGEGPGEQEDLKGQPFVGPAGELLNKILKAIDIDRQSVYIANIVKCRPPGNRDPEADEAAACRHFLERQIDLVKPRLIVALGRVAAQNLLGTTDSLGRLRGRWHEVHGVPVRATYHPAALLRYTKYKRPTWEDMQIVRDRLHESSG